MTQIADMAEGAERRKGVGPLIPPLTETQRPLRQQIFERIRAAGHIPRADRRDRGRRDIQFPRKGDARNMARRADAAAKASDR